MFLPLHDINTRRYIPQAYVNYGLIVLNVVVFIVQFALPARANEDVIVALAMIPAVVTGIESFDPAPWLPDQATLITYAFLHGDWVHLLTNMLFLWIFGDNVEDALGHIRYLVFYLACAAFAGLAHLLIDIGSLAPLIGASGAVAGVMGAYIVLYPHARVFVLVRIVVPIPLPIPALWMLGVWIAMQIFYAMFAGDQPVAWWAHLGGIAAGAALAVVMKRKEVPLFGGR